MRTMTLYRTYGATLETRRRVKNPRADLRVHPELWRPAVEPVPLLAPGEVLEVRR